MRIINTGDIININGGATTTGLVCSTLSGASGSLCAAVAVGEIVSFASPVILAYAVYGGAWGLYMYAYSAAVDENMENINYIGDNMTRGASKIGNSIGVHMHRAEDYVY